MARTTSRDVDCPVCGAGVGSCCVGSVTGSSRGRHVDYHPARRERAAVHNLEGLRRFAQHAIDYRLKYHAPAAIVELREVKGGLQIVLNSGGNFLEVQQALRNVGVEPEERDAGLFVRRPERAQ